MHFKTNTKVFDIEFGLLRLRRMLFLFKMISINVFTCFHLWFISGVALFVLALKVEEDNASEEGDDGDVGEGGARGGVVLELMALLFLGHVAGGLEGGKLLVDHGEVVVKCQPLHGGAGEEFSREEAGGSQVSQAGGNNLRDAHLQV